MAKKPAGKKPPGGARQGAQGAASTAKAAKVSGKPGGDVPGFKASLRPSASKRLTDAQATRDAARQALKSAYEKARIAHNNARNNDRISGPAVRELGRKADAAYKKYRP